MTPRARRILLALGAALLVVPLGTALVTLPAFGSPGPTYGRLLAALAVTERHAANLVSAVVFDLRGLDTLGEELILFAAAVAVSILLRKEEHEREARDGGQTEGPPLLGAAAPPASPALRWLAWPLFAAVALDGLCVTAHGHLTPGGGFQGGVLLAGAAALLYAASDHRAFRQLGPPGRLQRLEAVGVVAMLALAAAGLLARGFVAANVLPPGRLGRMWSGGGLPLYNLAAGLAVGGSMAVIISDFLRQTVILREARWWR